MRTRRSSSWPGSPTSKHASLGVTREQYAIVHEHLFAAIVQVLAEARTPEVAAAWDELYWQMADDEGDELRVPLPFGDLVLDPGDDPLLLVSAGIGCTPIIGMCTT
jgi:hypothetical protein